MSIQAKADVSRYSHASDRRFWISVVGIFIAIALIWLTIPWQWSPIDDPGQVIAMRALVDENGIALAILDRFQTLARGDLSGGIFRPMAWIYPPIMYLLPVKVAHLARLLMLLIALASIFSYFRQKGIRGPRFLLIVFIILAACSTLYQSLLLLSLQELGGVLFLCLGLASRNKISRIILFVAAALFKAPFAWLLIGNSVVLWRRGQRRASITSGLIGVAILGIGAIWSRSGTYAAGYRLDILDPELWKSAAHIFEPMNMLLLVSLVWCLIVTQSRVQRDVEFWLIAIAFLGYLAQMIPWGFTAYYMGPITFLLGLLLCMVIGEFPQVTSLAAVIALSVPALIACWFTYWGVNFTLSINNVMADSATCLREASASKTMIFGDLLYVTSSPEGPIRIEQNTKLQAAEWFGEVDTASNSLDSFASPDVTHAIVLNNGTLPSGRDAVLICSRPTLALYSLSATP